MSRVRKPSYGRCLDDFKPGDVYVHPRNVTINHLADIDIRFPEPCYAETPSPRRAQVLKRTSRADRGVVESGLCFRIKTPDSSVVSIAKRWSGQAASPDDRVRLGRGPFPELTPRPLR